MRILLSVFVVGLLLTACDPPKPENSAPAKLAPVTIGDSTKANLCRESVMALAAGDVDAFTSALDDNAIFFWNNMDSVAGKAAITAYWKDRRGNVMDKLEITEINTLPLVLNESKSMPTGDYVLLWAKVTASYKGGKSMTQYFHNVYHFNSASKIDWITQYVDRAPIMAAMPPPPAAKK